MSASGSSSGSARTIGTGDFQAVRDVVHRETGIRLGDRKRALVDARLGKRLRALHLSTYRDYLQLLHGKHGHTELRELINAITTNKTAFFREEHHFAFLRDRFFPGFRGRVARIWSAGCSSGAEPYSIAIVAAEVGADARILASDIDSNVLAAARTGSFDAEQLAGVSPDRLRRFFVREEADRSNRYRIGPLLRDAVTFEQFNLNAPRWRRRDRLDLIFCRNVVIYFDRLTQRTLFERFAALLNPGGLLILGHSESLAWLPDAWEACGRTMYRRRGDEVMPPGLASPR
ncbi:MAG: Chemotaxis protein methyltransferase [Gemmatimonadaceae bacterium]|nr:Chemotaxis protein methyltransferase [Gemmatimonadaceae bacterium]